MPGNRRVGKTGLTLREHDDARRRGLGIRKDKIAVAGIGARDLRIDTTIDDPIFANEFAMQIEQKIVEKRIGHFLVQRESGSVSHRGGSSKATASGLGRRLTDGVRSAFRRDALRSGKRIENIVAWHASRCFCDARTTSEAALDNLFRALRTEAQAVWLDEHIDAMQFPAHRRP
ncbi:MULTISPECIES: hypothetical protein [unclassified Mesorhizobium]|uniref:hypothetical protein n=1 Tax=unclassified Mesorhizobium TaxID=325217 RepID=UPI0012E3D036|nr:MULTISPECIES: hypothetical protein [unclassified Mesorhizobium]